MENEIKFKYGSEEDYQSVVSAEAVNDGDVYFTTVNSTSDDTITAGTIYRGGEIMGTADADKLILTEDLPLIGQSFGNYSDGDTIPAGTSIYDLFKSALQQEIWPSSQALSQSTTTVLSQSGTVSGSVEVGTSVTSTLSVAFSSSASYKTYPSTGGTSESTITVAGRSLDGDYTLTRTSPTSATVSTTMQTGTENDVTDTVSLTTDGAAAKYTASAAVTGISGDYIQYSNMGNEREVTNSYTSATTSSDTNNSAVATAYYRYYIGCTSATDPSTFTQNSLSDIIALNGYSSTTGLMTGSSVTITGDTVISSTDDANSIIAIMPASFDGLTLKQGMTGSDLTDTLLTSTFDYTYGSVTTTYKVYMLSTNQGLQEVKNVIITK